MKTEKFMPLFPFDPPSLNFRPGFAVVLRQGERDEPSEKYKQFIFYHSQILENMRVIEGQR